MFKIIGAVLLICSSTATGVIFARRLSRRKEFLQDFEAFLSSLETYIRFDNGRIEHIIEKCAVTENMSTLKAFLCNGDDKSPVSKRWEKWVAGLSAFLGLTKGDKKLLLEFGEALGVTDTDGQIKHIELYKTLAAKSVNEAQKSINEKSKLYKMFGFCAGTVIALMII